MQGLKIVSAFIIIAVLFSYVPRIPMDDCPEGNQMGHMNLDCGYLFHCPVLFDVSILGPSALSLTGRLVPLPTLPNVDEVNFLIFHPPKHRLARLSPRGGILA